MNWNLRQMTLDLEIEDDSAPRLETVDLLGMIYYQVTRGATSEIYDSLKQAMDAMNPQVTQ